MNLGVLASHEGTTLQNLIDAFASGRIPGRVSVVVEGHRVVVKPIFGGLHHQYRLERAA
jgi:folate-dependent phosphoribosylglycinamide formyltransferase PurN